VLLLMATQTYRAGAFLEAAERMGLQVVVGSQEAHALTHLNPAGHLALDFLDLEGATDRIVAYAAERPLAAVVATEDDGTLLAAMASEALSLKHSPLVGVQAARDKYQTRRALAAAGLRTPEFRRVSLDEDPGEIAAQAEYPCVVKPLALSASRGVMRADDPQQFVAAFERLQALLRALDPGRGPRADLQHVLVEGFIPGVEVALEGLLLDGQLTVLAIFDKPDPLDGPFFEETLYVTPSRHPPEAQAAVIETAGQAAAALGLTDGPIHAELRLNEAGACILEVAPRSIGGYCSRALRFGIDTSLEELILQQALGLPLASTRHATPASGVMMIPIPAAGILCEVQGLPAARAVAGIEEIRMSIPVGQPVVPPPEGSQYLGFIFARGDDPASVEAALRRSHARLRFVIEPPTGSSSPQMPTLSG
jgi:biotin carboxylase